MGGGFLEGGSMGNGNKGDDDFFGGGIEDGPTPTATSTAAGAKASAPPAGGNGGGGNGISGDKENMTTTPTPSGQMQEPLVGRQMGGGGGEGRGGGRVAGLGGVGGVGGGFAGAGLFSFMAPGNSISTIDKFTEVSEVGVTRTVSFFSMLTYK